MVSLLRACVHFAAGVIKVVDYLERLSEGVCCGGSNIDVVLLCGYYVMT